MTVRVEHGDCREVMRQLAGAGVAVDAVVTDPPYHLTSIVKRFGSPMAAPAKEGRDGAFRRLSGGFMGQKWDGGDLAFDPETWRPAFDLLQPGGYLVAFGGTRTHHRIWCAIEDAGFEIRDTISWLYASGFPKSRALLKPAFEPIVLARKPGPLRHLDIDGCRIETAETIRTVQTPSRHAGTIYGADQRGRTEFEGHPAGRWPANVVHDGSDEVLAEFARYGERGAFAPVRGTEPSRPAKNVYGEFQRGGGIFHGDSGTAARFFFSAKADADDRCDSKHPTVKPVALMRWLCRLVTPPGGLVLDPFAGSGTTGVACIREGFDAVLIEREAQYVADIRRRLARLGGADTPLFGEAAE